MDRYRIIEKPIVEYTGNLNNQYYPQYKLWGLFWIGINDELTTLDYTYSLDQAKRAIHQHKTIQKTSKLPLKIIEVEDE